MGELQISVVALSWLCISPQTELNIVFAFLQPAQLVANAVSRICVPTRLRNHLDELPNCMPTSTPSRLGSRSSQVSFDLLVLVINSLRLFSCITQAHQQLERLLKPKVTRRQKDKRQSTSL